MNKSKSLFLLLIALILNACGTYGPGKVTQPTLVEEGSIENEIIINSDYKTVWSNLIEYSASTFFAIDNFEKDSGLITLDFGSQSPGEFVDCGTVEKSSGQVSIVEVFDNEGNPKLTGSMNIIVKEITPNQTKVKVKARYVFSYQNRFDNEVWVFDTGGYDTQKFGVWTVTCQPTHKAEQAIIEGISQYSGS